MNKTWFDTRRKRQNSVGIAEDLFKGFNPLSCEEFMRPLAADPELGEYVKHDRIPVPAPEDREGYYGERHFCYWLSGLYDYKQILQHVPSVNPGGTVVDFGGASGRVARFFSLHHPGSDVIVAELNINHIDYVNDHFPVNTKTIKLSSYPHFMLADASVDLLYAFSVFTHIDAYELSWIAEIYRILKPGSYAYLTIHSEETWNLLPEAHLYKALSENREFRKLFREGQPMPHDRLVFEYNPESHDYNCNVFHHSRYIEAHWGKWFRIEKIIYQGHSYQTVVILRKP